MNIVCEPVRHLASKAGRTGPLRTANAAWSVAGPRRPAPPPPGVRAFTLVEILLVLALIALFATLLIPGANSMLNAMNERGPDQLLADAVLSARTEALESGRGVDLGFDSEKRQFYWGASASRSEALPEGTTLDLLPLQAGASILLGGELAENQEPLKRVRFFPDGTCESFRLRIKIGDAKPRLLVVDPWTCALSPITAKT